MNLILGRFGIFATVGRELIFRKLIVINFKFYHGKPDSSLHSGPALV